AASCATTRSTRTFTRCWRSRTVATSKTANWRRDPGIAAPPFARHAVCRTSRLQDKPLKRLHSGFPPAATVGARAGHDDSRAPLRLSVLVPCHNEEENVALLVEHLEAVLDAMPDVAHRYELVFVDDGSTDGTLA